MKPFSFVFGKRDRTRVFDKHPDESVVCFEVEPIKAEDIVKHRKRLGLSQIQYAQRLGVSLRSLQNWEQGLKNPNSTATATIKQFISEETVQSIP